MDDRDADVFPAAIAAANRARRRQDLLFAQDLFGRPRAHALGEDRALSERGAAPGMMTSPNEGRGVPEKVEKGRPLFRTQAELDAYVAGLDREMKAAAANLDFEKAAAVRDQIRALKTRDLGLGAPTFS